VVTSAAESDRSTVMSVRACGAPSTPAAPVGAQEWNYHLMVMDRYRYRLTYGDIYWIDID
jgi:hypothetical protein